MCFGGMKLNIQCLDEIYTSRYPRFFRIQYDRSSSVRDRRALDRFLETVRGYCLASLGWSHPLLLLDPLPRCLSTKRLRMEIVSSARTFDTSHQLTFPSYKRTYLPAPYHIVQEIQKFNLSDYRPRQEQ